MSNSECDCGQKFLNGLDFADHKKVCVGPVTLPPANDPESAPPTFCKPMDDDTLAPSDTELPIKFEPSSGSLRIDLKSDINIPYKYDRVPLVKLVPDPGKSSGGSHSTAIIKLDASALDDMNSPAD